MAILDKKLVMFDNDSIVGDANASTASTELDLGIGYDAWDQSQTPDIGEGGDIYVNVNLSSDMKPATHAGTLYLYTHTSTTVTGGSVIMTQAVAAAGKTGKQLMRAKIPAGSVKRYIGLVYTSNATTCTSGALDGWLSLDSESALPTT